MKATARQRSEPARGRRDLLFQAAIGLIVLSVGVFAYGRVAQNRIDNHLFVATTCGDLARVRRLLAAGVNQWAREQHHVEIATTLRSAGAKR